MSKQKSSLSQRALLVSVNISQWTGRKLDRKATETANTAHKASSLAGAYHKKLLPGATELKAISTIAGQAREYFYQQTLPWMADGSRIISSNNYLNFAAEIRKIKASFDHAVNEFVSAYPRLQAEAKKQLGDLYNEDEYPSLYSIQDRFNIDVAYLPLPDVKDFRVDMGESEKRRFIEKMREVESTAMRECWQRLHKVVKTAAERLSQPDAIFRDSLIENITELCALLPRLNVSDDAKLEEARLEVESLVSKLAPSTLRENTIERDKASKALADIESKMGAFMGRVLK